MDDEGGYSHGGGGRPDSERYDTSPGGSGGYGSGISLTLSIGFVLYEGNYYDGSSTYSYGDNVDPYDGRSNYSANGLNGGTIRSHTMSDTIIDYFPTKIHQFIHPSMWGEGQGIENFMNLLDMGVFLVTWEGKATNQVTQKITKSSLKRVKKLVKALSDNSRKGHGLSATKVEKLNRIVSRSGGTLRNDGIAGIRGSSAGIPHLQVDGLGKKIKGRHIWTQLLD